MYRQRLRALKMKRVLRKKELTAHSPSNEKKELIGKKSKKRSSSHVPPKTWRRSGYRTDQLECGRFHCC